MKHTLERVAVRASSRTRLNISLLQKGAMDYLKVVTVDFAALFDMSIGNHGYSDMSFGDED